MEFETRDEELVEDSFEAIGAELGSARLDRGIQLAELAQLLRISRHYLKDLEAGDHSRLPGPTYVSGYIRSVAREVGLDGEAMSQRYRALLDSTTDRPTYQFPIDNQQPQRSGAMIASILVIFAVAGYGGWYVAGKPDLMAGLLGSPEPEVTAAVPQVEITVTEPDDLVSGEAESQVVASAEEALAAIDTAPDATATDDLAAVTPADAAVPQGDGGSAAETGLAAVDSGSVPPLAVDTDTAAPSALAAAVSAVDQTIDQTIDQTGNGALQTDLAARPDASSTEPADGPATSGAAGQVADLAAVSDAAGRDTPDQTNAGEAQIAAAVAAEDDSLSGGGVAFARQRSPELEITVRATGISWVEIIRNDGEEVMTKLMREGEVYVVDSRDKLYLSTGNAGGLELLFHDGSVRPVGESGEILRDLPLDADRLRNQL